MATDRVRVMRIIEIEYDDLEQYEKDRERWALPANGVRRYGRTVYKAATFLAETIGTGNLVDLVDIEAKDPRPDSDRGIYAKYDVKRRNDPSGRHADCRFFVLDPEHDIHARGALETYQDLVGGEYPHVAADIAEWLDGLAGRRV